MKVVKFGGWSVGSLEKIIQVGKIIESDPERKIIVSSVPKGITDSIQNVVMQGGHERDVSEQESAEFIRNCYMKIANDAGLRLEHEINSRLENIPRAGSPEAIGLANQLLGEPFFCEKILAPALGKILGGIRYVDPISNIFSEQGAIGLGENRFKSYRAISRYQDPDGIVLFPGYVCDDGNGRPTVLKRGGSDTTGAVIAAATKASCYENFTNQEGIRVVDPAMIPDAGFISEITWKEYSSLAYRNFSVLDSSVIPYLEEAMIRTKILSHDNPSGRGTLLLNYRVSGQRPVNAIANGSGYFIINMYHPGSGDMVGYLTDLSRILSEHNISINHVHCEYDSMSFLFRSSCLEDETLNDIMVEFRDYGISDENINIFDDLSVIALVGQRMQGKAVVSKRASSAFEKTSIDIVTKDQGASQHSMMYCIATKDEKRGVMAQYDEFFN